MATQAGRVKVERSAKRVRVSFGGQMIVDTTAALLVWEGPHYPQYYVPLGDVAPDALVPSEHTSHSPSRGEARYWSVEVGGRAAVDAAWEYADSPLEDLRGHVRFDWDAMDHWFEEDEEIIVHPRSPYTRIDALRSSRRVQVVIAGETVADTTRATILFETGLPPRYYVPLTDVRIDALVHSATVSQCPYKGTAAYWSVRVGDQVHTDVAWYYPAPLPESAKIAGLVAFWPEKDDDVQILIDGEPL